MNDCALVRSRQRRLVNTSYQLSRRGTMRRTGSLVCSLSRWALRRSNTSANFIHRVVNELLAEFG